MIVLPVIVTLVATGCGTLGFPVVAPTPAQPAGGVGNPRLPVTLRETGSTLLQPFLDAMVGPLRRSYPNIRLVPSGGGSGRAVPAVTEGSAELGGSDAYLSDDVVRQHPELVNIPIAISAQSIVYNVTGLAGQIADVRLTGDALARMYRGEITWWDDPELASLNPGVQLPHLRVVPVRRIESSGDTFLFTSFLSQTSTAWRQGPGPGLEVRWPEVPGTVAVTGNPAMVSACATHPGCIAYVGVSAGQAVRDRGLGEALLRNKSGSFVKPTEDTITAAVEAGAAAMPQDLRQSLVNLEGARTYPIVNYEYVIVRRKQRDAAHALAVRTFLSWAIRPNEGSSTERLQAVSFVGLPPVVTPNVRTAIDEIAS